MSWKKIKDCKNGGKIMRYTERKKPKRTKWSCAIIRCTLWRIHGDNCPEVEICRREYRKK